MKPKMELKLLARQVLKQRYDYRNIKLYGVGPTT